MERFPFLSSDRPYGLAHRGGNEAAPENTVAAFDHALDVGCNHLETDVHLTNDGVLVAFHDSQLDRVASVPGSIADLSWTDLAAVEFDGGHRIPTMASLLETFPTARFNIDPKADEAVDPLIELIRQQGALDRVCIGAFSDARIGRLSAALGPTLCTSAGPRHIAVIWAAARAGRALSVIRRNPLVKKIAQQHGCLQVPTSVRGIRLLDTHVIELAHDLGLQVHVWTINDATEMSALLDAGVDALVTDKVSLLQTVLDTRA